MRAQTGLGARGSAMPSTSAHQLSVRAVFSPIDAGAGARWTLSIFREERRLVSDQGSERVYLPVGEKSNLSPICLFQDIKAGTYWIIGRTAGFARAHMRVRVHGDTDVTLQFDKAGALEVEVLAQKDEETVPLAGATVLVGEHDSLPWGSATNEKGRVELTDVALGPLRVRIYAPGYEPYEGMAEGSLVVRLRPASTLRVTVTEGGVVVPGARVFIAGVQLWPARAVVTGRFGRIDIAGLKPGRYALYAEKGDMVSPVKADVEVLTRSGVVDVTLALAKGHYASARVIARESEKPVGGARVTWSSVGLGQFSRHQATDTDGVARIGPLLEMGGVFTVRASGYVARLVPVESPNERDIQKIQVIRLERSGKIHGRVIDAKGFPVSGATVEVVGTDLFNMPVSVSHLYDEIADAHFDWAKDVTNVLIPTGELGVMLGPVPPIPLGDVVPSEGRRLTTNEKGYFVVRDVPPGDLVVLARHRAYMDGKSQVIQLGPGGEKETLVVLGSGLPLRGRVLDHGGFPVSGARVLVSARGFERRVVAATDGTFHLEAAPENVTLRISRLERPLQILLAREVRKTEREEEILVELPAPREMATLEVVDEKNEPVELAQVTLVSLDRSVPFKATKFTSERGKADFEETVGLKVRVDVSAPGFVTQLKERVLEPSGRVIMVAALSARGRVTGVRGRLPGNGATIVFRGGGVSRTSVADEVGEFRLTGLPPGVGELSATHPEHGEARQNVRLKPNSSGREVELPDLVLSPMVEVSGRVVDERGEAIAGAIISAERISPYLALGGAASVLGRSDEHGGFLVQVARDKPLYLYAAVPGRAFGFSDPISLGDQDHAADIAVIVDRKDKMPPEEQGTVLVALEKGSRGPVVYVVASGSQAERAGLRIEDVIESIDDVRPHDIEETRELLSGLPGSDLRMVVSRKGARFEIVTTREGFLRL